MHSDSHPSIQAIPCEDTTTTSWCGGTYVEIGLLGRGAFGVVYRARNTVTGQEVALKRLDHITPDELLRFRHERDALRFSRTPYVVKLLDDFVEGEHAYLVTEVAPGRAFPGPRAHGARLGWPPLSDTIRRFVLAIAHLHSRRVSHGDLKPANVLVDAHGGLTVLDLGLARHATLPLSEAGWGSPAWAAPEVGRPGACPFRCDVWSTAVMIVTAPTQSTPSAITCADVAARLRGRLEEVKGLPASVSDALIRMLSADPQERHATMVEALPAFGEVAAFDCDELVDALPERATVVELRALFVDDSRLLFTGEDAAAALFQRTGGRRDRVRAELGVWLSTGRVERTGDRISLSLVSAESLLSGERVRVQTDDPALPPDAARTLDAIRWLPPEATPAALRAVTGLSPDTLTAALATLHAADLAWPVPRGRWGAEIACSYPRGFGTIDPARAIAAIPRTRAWHVRLRDLAGCPAADLARATIAWAEHCLRDDRMRIVICLCGTALLRARAAGLSAHAAQLEVLLARAGLGIGTVDALQAALRLVEAGDGARPSCAVPALLRASIDLQLGLRARAAATLQAADPHADPHLDRERRAMEGRLQAAQGMDAFHAWLEAQRSWAAGSPVAYAAWSLWRSKHAYRTNKPERAVRYVQRAIAAETGENRRNAAQTDLGMVLLETGDLATAERVAWRARRKAKRLRQTAEYARATAVVRMAKLRRGVSLAPDVQTFQDLLRIGCGDAPFVACTEALAAVGAGMPEIAVHIAEDGRRVARERGATAAGLLLQAISHSSGKSLTETEKHAIAEAALGFGSPPLAVQVITELFGAEVPSQVKSRLMRWVHTLRPEELTRPREIRSVGACLETMALCKLTFGASCYHPLAAPY